MRQTTTRRLDELEKVKPAATPPADLRIHVLVVDRDPDTGELRTTDPDTGAVLSDADLAGRLIITPRAPRALSTDAQTDDNTREETMSERLIDDRLPEGVRLPLSDPRVLAALAELLGEDGDADEEGGEEHGDA